MLEEGILSFALLGAEWVLWLLVALSLGCIAVSLERVWYLASDAVDRAALAGAINKFLDGGDVESLRTQLRALKGFEARVLGAGLEAAANGPEAVERAMSGTARAERMRMERGLPFLAIVGSNAVYIGLFGTVLGILRAFHDLARNQAEANEAVMAGIAEALVATAVGLIVAIAAVVLYNLLVRAVKNRLGRGESLGDLVLARLYGSRDTSAPGAAAHGA